MYRSSLPSFTKRRASRSPHSGRPRKRNALDPPEDGELDDPLPAPMTISTPASNAPPLTAPTGKSKVPFPFKPKAKQGKANEGQIAPITEANSLPFGQLSPGPGVYERSAEDERRFKEADAAKRNTKSSGRRGLDHWEPGRDRYRSKSRSASVSPSGLHRLPNHRALELSPRRERDRPRGYEMRGGGDYYRPDREKDWGHARFRDQQGYSNRQRSPDSRAWTKRDDYDDYYNSPRRHRRNDYHDPDPYRPPTPSRTRSPQRDLYDRAQTPPYPFRPGSRPRTPPSPSYPPAPESPLRSPRVGTRPSTPPLPSSLQTDLDPSAPPPPPTSTPPPAPPPDVRLIKLAPMHSLPPNPLRYRHQLPSKPVAHGQAVVAGSLPNVMAAFSPSSSASVAVSVSTSAPGGKATVPVPSAPRDTHSPPPIVPVPSVPPSVSKDDQEKAVWPPPSSVTTDNRSQPVPRRRDDYGDSHQKQPTHSDRLSLNDNVYANHLRKRQKILRNAKRRSRSEERSILGKTFEGCGCGEQGDYEMLSKVGEGTFGEVHKALSKTSPSRAVALKRILMHNEKEGMPVTALREIKILKRLKHENVIELLDLFVVRSTEKDPMSVYMVFPYMDHDLAGLLENERVKLQPSHIKLYMRQLLEGTEYMHRNHILHRDMKAANLLISNSGVLRIADFGLARTYEPLVVPSPSSSKYSSSTSRLRLRERKYTNCVVTRWYRPPELLLGARSYGGEVDIWGIGCVLGEMFNRRPILMGSSDLDQLEKIWALCGTPNQHTWPNYDDLPGCEGVRKWPGGTSKGKIGVYYESIGPETTDLMDKLLTCNPSNRITASEALDHDYFWTDPLPADPKTLPSYEASHEFDKRQRMINMHNHQNSHNNHGSLHHNHHSQNHRHPNPRDRPFNNPNQSHHARVSRPHAPPFYPPEKNGRPWEGPSPPPTALPPSSYGIGTAGQITGFGTTLAGRDRGPPPPSGLPNQNYPPPGLGTSWQGQGRSGGGQAGGWRGRDGRDNHAHNRGKEYRDKDRDRDGYNKDRYGSGDSGGYRDRDTGGGNNGPGPGGNINSLPNKPLPSGLPQKPIQPLGPGLISVSRGAGSGLGLKGPTDHLNYE
ncbi:Pkinase-domain-containing protein [Dendrothele bispora CBS 962.96]|uniref:Pkinase-domain-containing protein n=1 Tax=Dendrothele bispora (strain CBS 962.96) TaxID=1314807 RepID=A0A4S8LYC9_DENBC|nr:Pkinase-domain-containing protein [Dendrothele bispora CBS 962.96]